ncbi:non-SMC mitotic condensation complex subunit 1 [Sporodiniella umbellata]|nr:non-SMC mitotic condensation complex subunit 1 [Sporodiniella umbellata]
MLQQQSHSNPLKPRSQLFTCLACQVAFQTSEKQRTHYRSEKSYSSENGFTNHVLSKKHKDTEALMGKEHLASPTIQPHHQKMSLLSDLDDTDNESVLSFVTDADRVIDTCLFCGLHSGDFESNLDHMKIYHGFFLPDIEYLEDPKGLVTYLSEKIVNDFTCLYCNGRGKEWKSLFAVRKHMLDKGHCKMAYDESEDPEDLLKFYDFMPLGEGVTTHTDDKNDLILEDGTKLGNRQFMRYYRQRTRRLSSSSSTAEISEQPTIEPRNRKERRQITYGTGDATSVNNASHKAQEHTYRQKDFTTSRINNLVSTNNFLLSDEILKLQEKEGYYIPNEIDLRGKSDQDISRYLNEITDSVEVSSENIADLVVFDKIRSFLKYFAYIQPRWLARLFDIVLSAFRIEIKSTSDDLEKDERESFSNHRHYLELYGYLIHWFLNSAEENATISKTAKKSKSDQNDLKTFDWSNQKLKAFDTASWLLDLKLGKLWTVAPERTTFITLFTKPAYQLFENPVSAKSSRVKERVFRILGLCVKFYEHSFVAQTTMMQNLQYWEHSAEPMAEFLFYLVDKLNYTQLADEILRDISSREFKDAGAKEVKDSPNPKTFSIFLTKLADLSPKIISKNISLLIHQLDSESYLMRSTIIDILGFMIEDLSKSMEENPNQMEQINGFFDILEERMLDNISYCRQRVVQVYLRLFE